MCGAIRDIVEWDVQRLRQGDLSAKSGSAMHSWR